MWNFLHPSVQTPTVCVCEHARARDRQTDTESQRWGLGLPVVHPPVKQAPKWRPETARQLCLQQTCSKSDYVISPSFPVCLESPDIVRDPYVHIFFLKGFTVENL